MDPDDWNSEYATQTDWLAAQLNALRSRPMSRRKKFINHTIRCAGCGDAVVLRVSLDPYLVIEYRRAEPDRELLPTDPTARLAAMGDHQRSIRLDKDWLFSPVSDSDKDSAHPLYAMCRCTGQHAFTVGGILNRKGDKSTSTPILPR